MVHILQINICIRLSIYVNVYTYTHTDIHSTKCLGKLTKVHGVKKEQYIMYEVNATETS